MGPSYMILSDFVFTWGTLLLIFAITTCKPSKLHVMVQILKKNKISLLLVFTNFLLSVMFFSAPREQFRGFHVPSPKTKGCRRPTPPRSVGPHRKRNNSSPDCRSQSIQFSHKTTCAIHDWNNRLFPPLSSSSSSFTLSSSACTWLPPVPLWPEPWTSSSPCWASPPAPPRLPSTPPSPPSRKAPTPTPLPPQPSTSRASAPAASGASSSPTSACLVWPPPRWDTHRATCTIPPTRLSAPETRDTRKLCGWSIIQQKLAMRTFSTYFGTVMIPQPLIARAVIVEHNTDPASTFTRRSKREQPRSPWKITRNL